MVRQKIGAPVSGAPVKMNYILLFLFLEEFAIGGRGERARPGFLENSQQERIFNGPAVSEGDLGHLGVVGVFEGLAIFTENRHIEDSSYYPKLRTRYQDFPYFRWAAMRFQQLPSRSSGVSWVQATSRPRAETVVFLGLPRKLGLA